MEEKEINANNLNNTNKVNSVNEENKIDKKPKKNHWTQSNVDTATKKINEVIYERNRQAPIHLKLDDLSIFINNRITRRGIAKGLVLIQESLNESILKVEKETIKALITTDIAEKYNSLIKAKYIMKVEMWTEIRFLMVNRAITPGEITELIRKQVAIDKDLDKWLASIK